MLDPPPDLARRHNSCGGDRGQGVRVAGGQADHPRWIRDLPVQVRFFHPHPPSPLLASAWGPTAPN